MNKVSQKIKAGIHKFKSLLPIYGFWGTVLMLLKSVLFVDTYYRFEKILSTGEEKCITKIPIQICTISGPIDLDRWEHRGEILKIRGEYGLEQFGERFADGFVMFCAMHEEKLAGFIWFNSFPVSGAGYKLKADEAYHIDGWVFEAYRGKGILPALQQAVFDYVRKNYPEIRILIGHATTWNTPSIIGQQKAGLVLVAKELAVFFLGTHRKFRIKTISSPIK
jgi:GNAT superfamily N-acetyltransferase